MKEYEKRERIITTKGKRPNEWILNIHGNEHIIYYQIDKNGEEGKLYVDGKLFDIQKKSKFLFVCFDQRVIIEGRVIHCVFDGGKFDLVVHGKYTKSKKDYIPIKKLLATIYIGVILIIAEFFMISIDAPVLPCAFIILGIIITDAVYTDYLKKKAKEE